MSMSSTLTQAESGPTPAAIDKYRRMIFDGVDNGRDDIDPATLADAWKLMLDARADMKIYRDRLDAVHTIEHLVPALKANVARLDSAMKKAASIGQTPVSAYGTLDQLLSAILECQAYRTPGMVSPQKVALSTAAGEVVAVQHEAMMLLRTTSDPAIGRQIGELSNEVSSLESAIRSREEILHIDRAITECEAKIARYAGDNREFFAEPAETRRISSREMYLKERRRLEELRGLAAQKPAAEAANAADQARILELRIRVGALERQRLEPREMSWHA